MLGETPVLYGLNAYSSGVVLWDRFAQDNYNSVTLARSGAGKSYFTKLETLRLLYQDVHVAVIDPEDEYRRLCDHVAGTFMPSSLNTTEPSGLRISLVAARNSIPA